MLPLDEPESKSNGALTSSHHHRQYTVLLCTVGCVYDEATTQLVSERDGELLAFFGYNATGTAEADRWRAQAGALAKRQLHKQYAPDAGSVPPVSASL